MHVASAITVSPGTRWCERIFCGLVGLGLLMGLSGRPAASTPHAADRWRAKLPPRLELATPLVHSEHLLVGRLRNRVIAYHLESGRRAWQAPITGVLTGAEYIAVSPRHVYAASTTALYILDLSDGHELTRISIRKPSALYAASNSIYVSDASGIHRFSQADYSLIGRSSYRGKIVAADDQRVVVEQREGLEWPREAGGQSVSRGRASSKRTRLAVITLAKGSGALLAGREHKAGTLGYTFRLFPGGLHRVLRFSGRKLAFVDAQPSPISKKPPKVYYTEVDIALAKKTNDISLGHLFHGRDIAPPGQGFFSADLESETGYGGGGKRLIFVAQGRRPRIQRATSRATRRGLSLSYDLITNEVVWQRREASATVSATIGSELVWFVLTAPEKKSRNILIARNSSDGAERLRWAIPAKTVGAPHPVDGDVIIQSPQTLHRLIVHTLSSKHGRAEYGARSAPESLAGGGDKPAKNETNSTSAKRSRATLVQSERPPKGWSRHRDSRWGFTIDLPPKWLLDGKETRILAQDRVALPFVRYAWNGNEWVYLASAHVLIRPAGGQNAQEVWRSVIGQRKRSSPQTEVLGVKAVYIDGAEAIVGLYRFRSNRADQELGRSLCLVKDGRAIEVRARSRPNLEPTIWRNLSQVMRSIRVADPNP